MKYLYWAGSIGCAVAAPLIPLVAFIFVAVAELSETVTMIVAVMTVAMTGALLFYASRLWKEGSRLNRRGRYYAQC